MPAEIFTHLSATGEAAAAKVAEAESAGAVARKLLDELAVAAGTATRTLPPDTSYREIRRYVDERSRQMVEIEPTPAIAPRPNTGGTSRHHRRGNCLGNRSVTATAQGRGRFHRLDTTGPILS